MPLSENPKAAWQAVKTQLQMDMGHGTYLKYIKPTEVISFEDGHMVIGAPTGHEVEWLNGRMISTVTGLLAGMMDQIIEVRFVVGGKYEDRS